MRAEYRFRGYWQVGRAMPQVPGEWDVGSGDGTFSSRAGTNVLDRVLVSVHDLCKFITGNHLPRLPAVVSPSEIKVVSRFPGILRVSGLRRAPGMSHEHSQTAAVSLAVSRGHQYAIRADLQYKVLSSPGRTGRGRTVSLSSVLVVFEPEGLLPAGKQIELRIEWPATLNESVGLRLCVTGTIVNIQAGSVSVKIQRYEFRTVYLPRQDEAKAGIEVCRSTPKAAS